MLISRLRIAASSSVRTVEAPCIDVPPVTLTFVVFDRPGAGEAVREALREEELLFDLKSEIRVPAAEGGARGVGAWIAGGLGSREKALLPAGVVEDETAGRFVM